MTLPEALRCWELESTERSALRRKHHLLITASEAEAPTSNAAASSNLNGRQVNNKLISSLSKNNGTNAITHNSNNNYDDTNTENVNGNIETNSNSRNPSTATNSGGSYSAISDVNRDVNTINEKSGNNGSDNSPLNRDGNQGNDLMIQSEETPILLASNSGPVHFSFPPSFVHSQSVGDLSKHTHVKLIEEKDVTSTTSTTKSPSTVAMSDASDSSSLMAQPSFVVGSTSQRRRKRKRKHRHRHNNNFNKRSKFPYGKFCRYHYIDNCSWPQCNRGCPKYYNPITGREMDFIELFKSLRLNLTMVADALGQEPAGIESLHKLLPPD